ncbi:uncharacterized protein LOC125061124 [Pieris napi]|uniref:uncharacterized protein LOC125061124 n=1 Tax=Pieris napi TaxID=78633 RepID=UPI001FB8ED4E|nr:uncharacterized protein LOC125061124 [Pieris napi]
MSKFYLIFLFSNFILVKCKIESFDDELLPQRNFVYWPNATVPFYINSDHFDAEQSLSILSSLSLFAFKTCLKFAPVMAEPVNHHVLLIENPNGRRKCDVNNEAHSFEEPHRLTLGYECLKSPDIDMMIMRALGFPFEHNRASRDVFIDVQFENIESGHIDLFSKDLRLPPELRSLSYDVNSVLHFGDREFSKNGHRTIIFKDRNTKQNRIGLTTSDLRKIEIVYGPECQKRDRQAKIDLCQHYPGIIRKKRNIDVDHTRSLRVNPDITPPPENLTEEVSKSIKDLGIHNEVQNIIEDVYKITSLALKNARIKYCNDTKELLRSDSKREDKSPKTDILGIIEVITEYTQNIVDNALANLTEFCETSQSMDKYVRSRCSWYDKQNGRCRQYFKSTKFGAVKYSTQHRPVYIQSTKHQGRAVIYNYAHMGYRAGPENSTDNQSIERTKRSVASDITEAVDEVKTTTHVTEKTSDTNTDNIETSKSILRMATTINSQKKKNYAPIMRRSYKNRPDDDSQQKRTRRLRHKKRPHRTEEDSEKIEIVERNIDADEKSPRKEKRKKIPRVKLSAQNKEFYNERKWQENVVRYIITDNGKYNTEDVRSRLEEVNRILMKETCVRLEEISDEDQFHDYLVLDTSPDYVTGRVGGRQVFGALELFEGGQHRQYAAMMVMAMLGFYFEISRHDRDEHIRVHNRHIRADKLHHFEKIRSDATLPLPYDYESATHPAWQFWRRLGKRGISSVATFKDKDPDGSIMKSLGQHEHLLSKYDIIKINSVYGIDCFVNQRRMKIKT